MKKYRISKTANHSYFNKVDNENKAYLLGFILADGCIEQGYGVNSIRIGNSTDDIEAGILFQKEIFPGNKIGYRKFANKKDVFFIKGSSKEIINDLNRFNIKPRKTYDINFVFPFNLINKNLYRHFIRGFFDGDGHITYHNNKLTFGFYATSKPFLEQIGKIFEEKFKIKYIIDTKKSKNMLVYCLRFNANQKRRAFIQKLYNWFYNDSKSFLIRKKIKFESYLNTVLI